MKKHFVAGLIILLPLAITYLIIKFIINLITDPFHEFVTSLLLNYNGFGLFSHEELINIVSKLLIIAFLFGFILLIGLIGRWFIFRSIIYVSDKILHAIPFVNRVYLACKDFTEAIFSPKAGSFNRVVLVPFPSIGQLSVGLVASEFKNNLISVDNDEFITVLIPGTPNPTIGFLLMFKKSQVISVDIKVQEALKYVMSCGSALPDYMVKRITQQSSKEPA